MRTRSLAAAVPAALLGLVLAAAPAAAAPTCTTPGTEAACGGRVVPEPELTRTFVQFDGPVESLGGVLAAIERIAPGYVQVREIGKSRGGRPMYVATVTDESVTAPKRQVAISLSVHGVESAGREGGIRYLEDLARWAAGDRQRLLYAGDRGVPLERVLREVEVHIGFTNPDGWAAGDLDGTGVGFQRGNADGVDLNRDFPTKGWSATGRGTYLDQPEAKAWWTLLESLPRLTTAMDIHGELTSSGNRAFSDLMWPAGQWDARHQAQERQLAEHVIGTVERKFAEKGVVLADLFGATIGQRPANVATGYDVVGYDDSGFMGDAMVQMQPAESGRVVEIDVENFLSHLVPNNAWVFPLEQAHVQAVRGNMEAVIVEALITDEVTADLDLGRVAYVDDATVTQVPGHPAVSRLRYFTDLARDAGTAVDALAPADLATTDLSAYDVVVLADSTLPVDPSGRPVDPADLVSALKGYAAGGGTLLLTDRAVGLADDLGLAAASDVVSYKTNAGHIDFVAGSHPWTADHVGGAASQTYYEVGLGFPARNQAPSWGVRRAAWEAGGGRTVGTVNAQGSSATDVTGLGEKPLGKGKVVIYGAVLPQASSAFGPYPNGLADYAVTVNGGATLHDILATRRGADGTPVLPAPRAASTAAGAAAEAATPGVAGALPAVALLGLLGLVTVARRRRA